MLRYLTALVAALALAAGAGAADKKLTIRWHGQSFFEIITSEGGTTPSRFKHLIKDPATGRYRVLTPMECERLNQFPDYWTNTGMPPNWRYFCMGNALVVGLIERMGRKLAERILDTPESAETSVTPVPRATAVSSAR